MGRVFLSAPATCIHKPLSTVVYSLVVHFVASLADLAARLASDRLVTRPSSPSRARPKLCHVSVRSLCVAQPRSVSAVSLLLSCDLVANRAPGVINIPSAERPLPSPDPLQNEPWKAQTVSSLRVQRVYCRSVRFPPSLAARAAFTSVKLLLRVLFVLLSVRLPPHLSVCSSRNLPTCLFLFPALRYISPSVGDVFALPH